MAVPPDHAALDSCVELLGIYWWRGCVCGGKLDAQLERSGNQIFALGSQWAVSNFQGPISASGKATFIVQQGETYWANALTHDQQVVSFTLQDPFTGYKICSRAAPRSSNPIMDQGKAFVELDLGFTCIANSTDSVGLRLSPIKTVTTNGTQASY